LTARIAFIDIETAPNLGYVWGMWEQDVIDIKENWYILSFAVKWGDGKTRTHALPDYPLYGSDRENDAELVKELHSVFEQADIIVAHNGDRFDIKKANARFIFHGLMPPTSCNTIDTLKIASNRLNDLGKYLGVGTKLPNTGKHLWLGCMGGDHTAWATMRRYNAQDVELLWRVYRKLRPWASTHPNLNLYSGKKNCPTCQSGSVIRNGQRYLKTVVRQQYRCMSCGHQWHGETISPVDIRLGEATKARMEATCKSQSGSSASAKTGPRTAPTSRATRSRARPTTNRSRRGSEKTSIRKRSVF
jgi:hypothetical protein